MNSLGLLILLGLLFLGLFLYFRFFKLYKVRNVVFIDGTLGSGKSFLSVSLAIRLWKRAVRQYKVKKFLLNFLSFVPKFKKALDSLEKPLLYSNIKLRDVEHVKLTKDLLTRQNFRFAYKSVILLDEITLMVDQMCYKDHILNERLTEFWKLARHQLHGGYIVVNSQSSSDLHFSIKNVLSDYLYIHHRVKLPFISLLKVQEMAYSNDNGAGTIINARTDDVETTLRTMIVFNHRHYDTYCYSIFTDGLPVFDKVVRYGKGDSLKDSDLVSWKNYLFLLDNLKKEEKGQNNNVSSPKA